MAKYNNMKKFTDTLGIDPTPELTPVVIEAEVVPVPIITDEQIDQKEDYTLARRTFRELITKGNDAIEGISDLAKQSESPRAYEVLATLMKTVADTTKDLYDLQKKTKDLKAEEKMRPQDEQRINVEKAVFVGSTAELLKRVKAGNESL
jgi:hypothetical protein